MVLAVIALATCAGGARAGDAKTTQRFDLGPGKVAPGLVQVSPATAYSRELGYGFDLGTKPEAVDRGGDDPLRGDFCTSDKPFFFSVALPEGNYDVTVTLGDLAGESTTTVKAESRRLMLEQVKVPAGKTEARTFTVNVRTPTIGGGGTGGGDAAAARVKLNAREQGSLNWDDKLTLEFNGPRPCVAAIEVKPAAAETVTVFVAGDSTVADQQNEPWNSWGQMLPRFLEPGVAVANHAESGRALRSFTAERRLDKVLSAMRPGDYLFVQFGHNDQKEKGPGVGALTTYKADLKRFVAEARKRGGLPIVVTPVNRRSFDKDGKITNSLGDYPEAVRQVAKEDGVPLVDLNAMSKPFYEAMGPEGSKRAFVDNTHHNAYGSYELAKCVAEGIRRANLPLADRLADGVPAFDPAKPDPVDAFNVPPSPQATTVKPEGS